VSMFDEMVQGGLGSINPGTYRELPPTTYVESTTGEVFESAPMGEAPGRAQGFRGTIRTPEWISVDALIEQYLTKEANAPGTLDLLEKQFEAAGFTSLEEALVSASLDKQSGTRSFEEYWAERAKNPYIQELVAERERGRGGGGPTSQVNLSSESEAGALLDQVFTNYLGRTATDEEVQEWQKVLNQAQMANPVRNTGGTNSVTSGGFDTTRFAREYAQSQEGYAERFAAVNFMSALDSALQNRGNYVEQFAKGEQ